MSRRVARIFVRGGQDDGGTKGPERGAKRQSAGRGVAVALPSMGVWGYAKFSKNQRWNCTFSFGFINVWRVTPVAKQSSVCNSGAKNFFQSMTGGTFTHAPPSGYAPDTQLYVQSVQQKQDVDKWMSSNRLNRLTLNSDKTSSSGLVRGSQLATSSSWHHPARYESRRWADICDIHEAVSARCFYTSFVSCGLFGLPIMLVHVLTAIMWITATASCQCAS